MARAVKSAAARRTAPLCPAFLMALAGMLAVSCSEPRELPTKNYFSGDGPGHNTHSQGGDGVPAGADSTGAQGGDGPSVQGDVGACAGIPLANLKPSADEVAAMMLVVDRSQSMGLSGEWTGLIESLASTVEELDDIVDFGLLLFPVPGNFTCGVDGTQVDPAANQGPAIREALEHWQPLGGTPTAEALRQAGAHLAVQFPNNPRYVVLATDGIPSCNEDLDPTTCVCTNGNVGGCTRGRRCIDDVAVIAAVEQLSQWGVATYVIGIPGSEPAAALLDEMAVASGTDRNGSHYAVTDASELTSTLETLAGSVVPCVYDIDTPPAGGASIEIMSDGAVVPRDLSHVNGWDLIDGTHITLYGQACDTLRDGQYHSLTLACTD